LREPKVNAAFDGDAIIHYGDINLAVAVAIDEGLVTPVIRGAQNKSLREISAAVKDLAHRVTETPIRGFWSYWAELMGVEPEGAIR